jgi:MerR family mercuric resistance operon transcriptional regulator
LQRLCFVRAAFEAGIGLDALARLCRALDAADGEAAAQLAVLRQFVERRREALADLEAQLACRPTEPAQHAESLP